ncbi:uncharacterized protein VTP21DRAFT_9005 [Calcarisporiella thermophila]|uniref:uncharacterized protein n=1 Tax=Calcarisporiella thermophila TaxID=911321 RepID=UPI003743DE51
MIFSLSSLSALLAISLTPSNVAAQGSWKVIGRSGVPAMHAVLTTESKIVIIDKAEPSELTFPDGTFAWASEYDLNTNKARPLRLKTNSFCSAGSFLGDGTLIEFGGDIPIHDKDTVPADIGFQTVRIFKPCSDNSCQILENPGGKHMSSNRWYPTAVTLPDGRVLIAGGSTKGQGAVAARYNNPTYEIFPRKPGEAPNYELPILRTTIPYNLYPQIIVLPNGNLFVLSNKDSVIYDWVQHRTVKELPRVPGVARTYPLTGGTALLPLDPSNNYRAEIVVCGGAQAMDRALKADDTCIRIAPLDANPTWTTERMPNRRTMPDLTLLADGNLMIVNGAQTGFAGYSNAKDPQTIPVLYKYNEPAGKRFRLLAPSDIARIYHSVAMLIPDGRVWVAGSNPHSRISKETEFRVEAYSPDYLLTGTKRPQIVAFPAEIQYGETFKISVDLGQDAKGTPVRTVLVNLGFSTHSTHMSQRQVGMRNTVKSVNGRIVELAVTSPPNANIFPPGKHWLFVLRGDGVPAIAKQIWIHQ